MIFNELWVFVSMLLRKLDYYAGINKSLDPIQSFQKSSTETVQAVFASSWDSIVRYAPLLDGISAGSTGLHTSDVTQLGLGCTTYAHGQHNGEYIAHASIHQVINYTYNLPP